MVYRAALPKGLNAVVVKIELPDTVDPFRYGGEACLLYTSDAADE